jgi:hypothetical protein
MYQLKRLQWEGYVQRMEGTRIPKKVFRAKFVEVRSVGSPGKDGKTGGCHIFALSRLEAGRWR